MDKRQSTCDLCSSGSIATLESIYTPATDVNEKRWIHRVARHRFEYCSARNPQTNLGPFLDPEPEILDPRRVSAWSETNEGALATSMEPEGPGFKAEGPGKVQPLIPPSI